MRYGYTCDACGGTHDTVHKARACAHAASIPGHSPEDIQKERRARWEAERAAKGAVEVSRGEVEKLRRYFDGRRNYAGSFDPRAAWIADRLGKLLADTQSGGVNVLRADLEDMADFFIWAPDSSEELSERVNYLLGGR